MVCKSLSCIHWQVRDSVQDVHMQDLFSWLSSAHWINTVTGEILKVMSGWMWSVENIRLSLMPGSSEVFRVCWQHRARWSWSQQCVFHLERARRGCSDFSCWFWTRWEYIGPVKIPWLCVKTLLTVHFCLTLSHLEPTLQSTCSQSWSVGPPVSSSCVCVCLLHHYRGRSDESQQPSSSLQRQRETGRKKCDKTTELVSALHPL